MGGVKQGTDRKGYSVMIIAVCVHHLAIKRTLRGRKEVLFPCDHPPSHWYPTRFHRHLRAVQVSLHCVSSQPAGHPVAGCCCCRFLTGNGEAFSTEPLKNENQDLALGFYHMQNVRPSFPSPPLSLPLLVTSPFPPSPPSSLPPLLLPSLPETLYLFPSDLCEGDAHVCGVPA